MTSPTARSLKVLRDRGYHAEVVERWIPGANIRKDFAGFIDILALKDDEVLAVQTTSDAHVAERVSKITEHEKLPLIRGVGWGIHVHGWRKNAGGRWVLREVNLS